MTSLTLPRGDYPRCPDCGQTIINPGGHAERCTGPRVCRATGCTNSGSHGGLCRVHYDEDRAAECSCEPGWHEPGCELAYWPEDAA